MTPTRPYPSSVSPDGMTTMDGDLAGSTTLTPARRHRPHHHQRTRADPSTLLGLFGGTAAATTAVDADSVRNHQTPHKWRRRDDVKLDPAARDTPSTSSSSPSSSSPMYHPSPNLSPRNPRDPRWSVWTADSTLLDTHDTSITADEDENDDDDDPTIKKTNVSHVATKPPLLAPAPRPAVGIHMGIGGGGAAKTNDGTADKRCSVTSSCSSGTSSLASVTESAQSSSARSPYTPCSIDSQPRHLGLYDPGKALAPSEPSSSSASRTMMSPRGRCPSPDCSARKRQEQEDEDENGSDSDSTCDASALDAALTSTMKALEAANSLLISTMSSRTHLARLRAAEDALDHLMSDREKDLIRQIESNRAMADHMDRVCAELADMARAMPAHSPRPRQHAWNPTSTPLTTAETRVSVDPKLGGIVEALDENATVGKTAAKRLERMLAGSIGSSSSSTSTTTTTPPPVTSDAKSLLSSLAAASPSALTASTSSSSSSSRRRSQSQSQRPDLSNTRSASLPVVMASGSRGARRRPSFTRGRSSLSQAFGMLEENEDAEGQCTSPRAAAQYGHDEDTDHGQDDTTSVYSTPTSTTAGGATSITSPTPSLLAHSRKTSYTTASHARSPSVIKPSTASSALLSPGLDEWDRGRERPDADSSAAASMASTSPMRGQGALAALKILNAQRRNGGVENQSAPPPSSGRSPPKRMASSPRLGGERALFQAQPESGSDSNAATFTTTYVKRKASMSAVDASRSSSTSSTATHPQRNWGLSSWMKFGSGSAATTEVSDTTTTPAITTPSTPSLATSTSMGSVIEHDAATHAEPHSDIA